MRDHTMTTLFEIPGFRALDPTGAGGPRKPSRSRMTGTIGQAQRPSPTGHGEVAAPLFPLHSPWGEASKLGAQSG